MMVLFIILQEYQRQVVRNAQALSEGMRERGWNVVTGGTDNHIVLVDLRDKKLSGSKAERILEDVSISCNKNTGKQKEKLAGWG